MAYIGNSPQKSTVLRLEARKSFALSVWVRDANGRPLDISTTELRLVMKKLPLTDDPLDAANLIVNDVAEIVDVAEGLARFNLQASDLNHAPGEYPFALIIAAEGYSTVGAKGIIDLQQNTEFASIASSYLPANAPSAVALHIGEQAHLTLLTGPSLAPGTTSFTDGDKAKLDGVEPKAQVNVAANWASGPDEPGFIMNKPLFGSAAYVDIENLGIPAGGSPGEALVKLSASDFHIGWAQVAGGSGSTLPATGVTAGLVPIANGANGWAWGQILAGVQTVNGQQGTVVLSLNDVGDTETRVALSPDEKAKLGRLQETVSYTTLTDLPVLGTAATKSAEEFLQPGGVSADDVTEGILDPDRVPAVSALNGFRSGTAAPSGGFDGELYFQYS